MNLNIPPSSHEDIDQNPFSCQFLFNSMQNHTAGYCDHQFYHLPHHRQQGDSFGCHFGSSSYNVASKAEAGIKLCLWNEEDEDHHVTDENVYKQETKNSNPIPNHVTLKINSSVANMIQDDRKILAAQSCKPDSNSSIVSYTTNPIRVCSDCNTTKTPLWRSGPKGPKSLCNACGIRQRKARRAAAMAAASVATDGTVVEPSSLQTIKLKKKEKISKKRNASRFNKQSKMAAVVSSSYNGDHLRKKLELEDFLINLSKNLAFRFRVFPQDEKDAAILLMALSSGLIHG